MLQNAYFLAKIGADTAENEQHFAKILPKIGNYPTGPYGSPGRVPRLARRRAPRGPPPAHPAVRGAARDARALALGDVRLAANRGEGIFLKHDT